jgi:hypothetical protein
MSEKIFATGPCGSTTTSGFPLSPAAESCKRQQETQLKSLQFRINIRVLLSPPLIARQATIHGKSKIILQKKFEEI